MKSVIRIFGIILFFISALFYSCSDSPNIILPDTPSVLITVIKNGKWGMLDTLNRWVIPNQYEALGYFSEGLLAAKKEGKWGFIDFGNNPVIPFQFDSVGYEGFQKGFTSAQSSNGKWGLIDKTGKFVIEAKYIRIGPFSGEAWQASRDEKYSDFIDSNLTVISCSYEYPGIMTGGRSVISVTGPEHEVMYVGAINSKGVFIDYGKKFILINDFYQGTATASIKYGPSVLLDTSGKILYTAPEGFRLSDIYSKSGYIIIERNSDYKICGLLDLRGKLVIDSTYDDLFVSAENRISYKLGSKWGLLRSDAKKLTDTLFDHAAYFNNGLSPQQLSDKFGYIDTMGNWAIQPRFSDAGFYFNGYAAVCENGKYGVINQKGIYTVKPQYDSVGLSNWIVYDLLAFRRGNKWGLISATGKEILPFSYGENEIQAVYLVDKNGNSDDYYFKLPMVFWRL